VNGILNFALGLNTGGFLMGLSGARAKLLEFTAALFSVDRIYAGFRDAIERGEELKHLSDQTGETVENLYKLQEGFKAVGVDAGQLPEMLLRMQQTLSGLGRGAVSIPLFGRLGLDIGKLKSMGAADQIEAISTALSKLDKQSATGVASQMFGIQTGAMPFMQIVGSAKAFKAAMADADGEAKVFARNAAIFEKQDATFLRIKGHLAGMFAGFASGIVPLLQQGADWIQKWDDKLVQFGEHAARIVRGIIEAFKEGKIGELLELTFGAAVEFMTNLIAGTLGTSDFWTGIFDVMVASFTTGFLAMAKMMASLGTIMDAAMDTAFQNFAQGVGKTPLGRLLGLSGFKANSFEQNYQALAATRAPGQEFFDSLIKDAGKLGDRGITLVERALQHGFANSGGPEQTALINLLHSLMGGASGTNTPPPPPPGTPLTNTTYTYTPEVDAFQKMGFVMRGGSVNPATEIQRGIRDNTQKMVGLLQTTVQLLDTNSIAEPEHGL